ncbi:methyltransferase domain-containing protein [Paraburkholderia bryophila]|uniref:methyltransferase domain-containing protein n=1 Tax=Burkholderiaceae TaxID=119060 RepID=UPI000AC607E8|nr:methyltransferase domain-containing protein [Burkholderia sp. 9120]
MVTEWDANQYRLFALERNWPNEELIAKIQGEPSRIADLGCGSGDCSTLALRRRYPHADIHAIDSSASLIDEARQLQPAADVEWRTGLIETFEADEGTDLLYLGSSFQWIADHPRQLARLGAMLTAGGTLAIQMPNMFCTPFYTAILAVAGTAEWKGRLQGKLRQAPVLGADEYAAIMASLGVTCEIWTSTYELTFSGVEGLVEWAKGAPLRPVSSMLDPASFEVYCQNYSSHLARHYQNDDGSCTLPFERLFMVARR